MLKKCLGTIFIAISVILFASPMASAAPSADILYYETDVGGGLWQYDYIYYNTSTAGEYLYGVMFDINITTAPTISVPAGWTGTYSTEFNVIDTFSNEAAYDIAAWDNLSGFRFIVDYQAGDIPYTASFNDGNGGFFETSGTTAVTPEPISSILFVAGGATLAFRGYRKRKSCTSL